MAAFSLSHSDGNVFEHDSGAKVYFTFGALANSTDSAGLTLLGSATRQWTRLHTSFRVPAEDTKELEASEGAGKQAPVSRTIVAGLCAACLSFGDVQRFQQWSCGQVASPQLMLAPARLPECGGCSELGGSVWIDDVAVEPA